MNGISVVDNHEGHRKKEIHNQILAALQVVHNPRSTNQLRQDASCFLEDLRSKDEAPYNGFELASDKDQPPVVRHYGLSLLEYGIRHKWANYTAEQGKALQDWVVNLATRTASEDPPYITNKVAELWVEIAKRSWGLGWMDMDELLLQLWEGSVVQKILVLTILETLSEEIFGNDDTTAALRGSDLNRACVEIFTPAKILSDHCPTRETAINVRYGTEGWLSRMADLLNHCVANGKIDENQQICAVKSLFTFKSVITWIIPRALVSTQSVNRICSCLASSNTTVQLVGKVRAILTDKE